MGDEVVRRQLRVVNPLGVHARPAALLVQLANKFQSEIGLIRGAERVDAKSVLQLMTLAAEQGTVLLLEARGADATSAADAIEKLFQDGLGDMDVSPTA
jgi:phosphotransferase system HPr (HPr) family protein